MGDISSLGVVHPLPMTSRGQAAPAGSLEIGSDSEIASRVADLLRGRYGHIACFEGEVLVWRGTHWGATSYEDLIAQVRTFDGCSYPTAKGVGTIRLGRQRIDSVLHILRAEITAPDFDRDAPIGINCTPGFIIFDKEGRPELLPHHPDQRQRFVLPARWSPGADPVPPAASLLARLLDGCFRGDDDAAEKQALMAEIAGAAALGVATHLAAPKAVILCGPSAANGKSAINDMIRALLPADAVASISPAKLHDERFRIHLAGKLLNASDELGETAIFGEDFKAAVTGDPMTGKEVYKPAVQFRPRALQLLACNRFPAFEGGMDAGVRRRLLVIPFNRTIPEDERVECMGRRIGEEEGDILLAWAVAGASRLMKRRGFASLKSSQEALAEWILTTDPVGGWMRERLDVTGDPSHIVGTTQAYDCFRAWADREGIHKIKLPTRGQFTAQVASSGLKGIHVVRLNRGTVIRGARLLGPHPVGDAEVTPESRRFAG